MSQSITQHAGEPVGTTTPTTPAKKRKHLFISPPFLLISAFLAVVSPFLRFNPGYGTPDNDLSDGISFYSPPMNGWTQALVNIENDRIYGWLMAISFALAALAAFVLLMTAILAVAGVGATRWIVLPAVLLGLLPTAGLFIGYLLLGALSESTWGMWVYAASFLPSLPGALGITTRLF